MKLYVDGTEEASADISGVTGTIDSGSNYLQIGGWFSVSWAGSVDEAAIWTVALTGADITSIYNSGEANDLTEAASYDVDRTSNLVGYWRLGDGSDASVTSYDVSSNSLNATLINGAAFQTDAPG